MSQIDEPQTVDDPVFLNTLPPPPVAGGPEIIPGRPRGRAWTKTMNGLVRASAAAAGLSAGPRRPPASRTRPAVPEPAEPAPEPDPVQLAKLPPPPVEVPGTPVIPRVDIVVTDDDGPTGAAPTDAGPVDTGLIGDVD